MSKREGIFNDVRDGKYQYVFATYSLAKEGLDIPRLNKLVMATPVKDKVTVEQAVGRIQRPDNGKPMPVVYDICDCKVPQLRRWKGGRKKVYKEIGGEIRTC
jgi:superfamily II DNA or RNA helicase